MKLITASFIKQTIGLNIPAEGKRCFITLNDLQRIEMAYTTKRGITKGIEWYFICPVTLRRCRKLYLVDGIYKHNSLIKGFARLNKPAWFKEGSIMNEVLHKKQNQINASKLLEKPYFKKYYNGKPTKLYLKCLKHIQDADGISMLGIINGDYEP